MAMQIRKASRNMTYLKMLLSGPSGCGKTMGALKIATGMLQGMPDLGGNSRRIGFIGTESVRDELYADEYDYDVISLSENQKNLAGYTEAFDTFLSAGYGIIIIDSMTHLWNWVQEMVRVEESSGRQGINRNTVSLWGKWKKENKKFQDKLLFSNVHVIATARGKDEYVMETNDRGKLEIKKVGVGSQQDKDTEYEFMVSLQIDQKTHQAWATKDNSHLWDGAPVELQSRVITEADGVALIKWAINGISKEDAAKIANLRTTIVAICNEKGGTKNFELMAAWKKALNGRQLNQIDSIETLEKIKAEIDKIDGLKAENPTIQDENVSKKTETSDKN